MTGVLIRPATLDDIVAIVDLYAAVAAEGRWVGRELPFDLEETRERFAAGIEAPDHYNTVAELTEPAQPAEPAGPSDPTGRGPGAPYAGQVGYLHLGVAPYGVAELGMHVAAAARGQGVGRAL